MITRIKVGEKERPFLFSYRAIKESERAEKSANQSVKEGEKPMIEDEFEVIERNIYLGFKYGALAVNQEPDFTPATIANWLDEDLTLVHRCMMAIAESKKKFLGMEPNHPNPATRKKK